MVKVERTIAPPGSAAEVAEALVAHAREVGLRADVDAAAGAAVLRGGESLAFNLNVLRRTLRVEGIAGPDAVLRLVAESESLPWERPRVRRALEGHLDALARRLQGGPPGAAPFAFCAGPASTGAPAAIGGILLSGLCAVVAAMLVMGAYGLIHVHEAAVRLAAQAVRIEALGEVAIPSSVALATMSGWDRLAAAAFYAVPLGWLGGGLLALAWGLGEIVPRWGWLGGLAVLFVLLEFLVFLVPAGPVLPGLLVSVLLPAAAWVGYGIPWSVRRVVPAGAGTMSPRPWRVAVALGAAAALAAGVGLAFFRLPGLHTGPAGESKTTAWEESATGLRDRVLLGTAWGRNLTDFYYRHTYLPAETIRHPRHAHQRIALVVGDPGPLPVSARFGRQWMFYPAKERGTTWFYVETSRSPDDLPGRLHSLPDVVLWLPSGPDAAVGACAAPLRAAGPALIPRLLVFGGPASLVSAGGPVAGARRLEMPVRPETMAAALGSVLDAQDRAGGPAGIPPIRWIDGLRGCVGIALFSLVLGAGLLLPLLAAWSAWAWGALGAAAAPGTWTRRAAWIAGPAAALAAWAALGAAAIGDGPGLCPPPVPSVDPVRMLASGDACARLDALQQMMAARQRDSRVHSPEAQSLVRAALGDADPRVRFWAVAAAGELHHRGTVPFLVERLGDVDLRVRYRAARSLGLLADPSGIEPLRQRVRDETWYAADYARQALRHIAIQRGGS